MTRRLAADMAAAAAAVLDSLDDDARARIAIPVDDPERVVWMYWPADRRGVPLKAMSAPQRERAFGLVDTALSAPGARTVRAVVAHEEVLGALEREGGGEMFPRDPELYYLTVFGEPDAAAWAWRFEGHHVSLHVAVAGDEVAATPSFVGANPAEVPSGPRKGVRILAPLEDRARALVRSLDAAQRVRAVIAPEAPPEILSSPLVQGTLGEPEGLAGSGMTGAQRTQLIGLVREHVGRAAEPIAEPALARLDLDGIRFAWAGGLEAGEPHYYRIHGGSFLIEYDNVQNEANHIHAVWRDLDGDFGADLLRRHHAEDHGTG